MNQFFLFFLVLLWLLNFFICFSNISYTVLWIGGGCSISYIYSSVFKLCSFSLSFVNFLIKSSGLLKNWGSPINSISSYLVMFCIKFYTTFIFSSKIYISVRCYSFTSIIFIFSINSGKNSAIWVFYSRIYTTPWISVVWSKLLVELLSASSNNNYFSLLTSFRNLIWLDYTSFYIFAFVKLLYTSFSSSIKVSC